jgi:hypothetical protein
MKKMKIFSLTAILLFAHTAFATSDVVSITMQPYSGELGVTTRNAAQLLANAAYARCQNGVSHLSNINLQFVDAPARAKNDETGIAGNIWIGSNTTVIATALVTCK